jgi:hypothetical protein
LKSFSGPRRILQYFPQGLVSVARLSPLLRRAVSPVDQAPGYLNIESFSTVPSNSQPSSAKLKDFIFDPMSTM